MKTRNLLLTTILSASVAFSAISSVQASPINLGVVHDERGGVVTSTNGNCVRTKWLTDGDECQRSYQQVARVQEVRYPQIDEEQRTVYFGFNQTNLMDSERSKLDSLANVLKSANGIERVRIVGYADRIGTANYNDRLSERRAKVVEEYLRQNGYLNTTTANTRGLGETVPSTSCKDNLKRSALINCLEMDRRATVEIKYSE